MPNNSSFAPLGRCPRCESAMTEGRVLIEYTTDTGPKVYAECPECHYIAHPATEKRTL